MKRRGQVRSTAREPYFAERRLRGKDDRPPTDSRPVGFFLPFFSRLGVGSEMRFCRMVLLLLVAAPAWAGGRERRLASLLPSHSEIVTALGARTALVAVSDSEHPGDFPGLPRAGALEPRWEVLMALRPDLVLADSAHERFAADFKRFHLPVLFLPATHAKSIEDVFELIRVLGDAIERGPQAAALLSALRERLARLDARPLPAHRPRVYFEIWPRPLQSVGAASFQGQLLKRAGFDNIVPDTTNEMPLLSSEWIVKSRPDVVFHTGVEGAEDLGSRPGWKDLPAVRSGRVIRVDADLISRAGPRVVEALAYLMDEAARP